MKAGRAKTWTFFALALVLKTAAAIDLQPWPPVNNVVHGVHFWHQGPHGEWINDDRIELHVRAQLNRACRAERFKPVQGMTVLPPQLLRQIVNRWPIADIGQAWEATDVEGPEGLPFRRLATSALGEHYALIAIEHGGGPNWTEFWVFQHQRGQWQGGQLGSLEGVPDSLAELMYQVCDGYPKPAPRLPRLDVPAVK